MAVSENVTKTAISIKLNYYNTETGKSTTKSISLGSLQTQINSAGNQQAMNIINKLTPMLEYSLETITKTTTATLTETA